MWEDVQTIYGLAAAGVEAGLVPEADEGVPLTIALFKRLAEVVADGGDDADIAARRAVEQDACPIDLDPSHAVLCQLLLVQESSFARAKTLLAALVGHGVSIRDATSATRVNL